MAEGKIQSHLINLTCAARAHSHKYMARYETGVTPSRTCAQSVPA